VLITWDPLNNETSLRKHGVSFEEAQDLFLSGADYFELYDEDNSADEDRFIAIGPIPRGVVPVVWTERDEAVIRIISARWATPNERSLFHTSSGGQP
jgi:uncharacterized protein